MAEPTRGTLRLAAEGGYVFVYGGPNNDDIAEFFHCEEAPVATTRDEALANARLFVEAPRLLEALRNCVDYWPSALNDDLQERTLEEARAALKELGE